MAPHRVLLRGNGFYDVLVRGIDDGLYGVEDLADDFQNIRLGDSRATRRRLPVVNLDLDHDHLTDLLQDVLPEDRSRFYNYMSKRLIGLECISAIHKDDRDIRCHRWHGRNSGQDKDGLYEVEELVDGLESACLFLNKEATRSLHVVDLLKVDHDYLTALLQDALPDDHTHVYNYMSKRPLGLGCIGYEYGSLAWPQLWAAYAISTWQDSIDAFTEQLIHKWEWLSAHDNRQERRLPCLALEHGVSILESLHTGITGFIGQWNADSTGLVTLLIVLVTYRIASSREPDVHPLLLARQAGASAVRNESESTAYRCPAAPHSRPLNSGLDVKDPGASRWSRGRDGDIRNRG
ncbi:uncharacterized protein TRIVIDRAFT_217405 [Trichoderma virens Gv29-8]|uniref:Uncharacterized protein n=1 Tax=Hypocrea virens (strain Gv29-8 / FGSC 10586) TaxID=413071 RepID=G9MFP4_HYPVG|nr:uncharacterized protein TRIVIDRAFT_217405 [Trichoderma virens Gv29-8]EHK26791.1 hypothetical protein TRIVIDRAFT_217405 [Trichoderma virens Gv29-8]UKZ57246.1 hypothetical protein TrVGV298_011099 [Trichoderma virens]